MSVGALIFVLLALATVAWAAARARATGFASVPGSDPARYHGWYAALGTGLPALALLVALTLAAPALGTAWLLHTSDVGSLPTGPERAALLATARAVAAGDLVPPSDRFAAFAAAYRHADAGVGWSITALVLLAAVGALALTVAQVRPALPARVRVERAAKFVLRTAALLAVLVTVGIVVALLGESLRFFRQVPLGDFLLGTHWSPQVIDPAHPGATLGAVPLFWGTFLIGGVIAMAVAVPLGLISAIHLAHHARPATRRRVKPLIELLAGIPTVVYGFVAALFVAPAVRDLGVALGIADASAESALAAGLAMGVMLIPLVFTLSDDALAAVPRELRDASLALGATTSETVRHVLLPAALPGVIGGVLLAVSRAVGETMIVVMAASGVATLTADPFAPATTVTRQIVDLLTGESTFDSPKTLAAFALGLVLFVVTLLLNLAALVVVRRYRAAYE